MYGHKNTARLAGRYLAIIVLLAFIAGCAEQPVGYVFRPTQRDEVSLARVANEILGSLYSHTDMAVEYLEDASLTNDYATILPGGWYSVPMIDTTTNETYTTYIREYLGQQVFWMRFDKNPDNNSIRTPSDVEFGFYQLRTFQNGITSEYYLDISESRKLQINYSNENSDPDHVDGWFNIRRAVPFEEEIAISADYGGGSYSYTYYMYPSWVISLVNFSTDKLDQSAVLNIEGTFPMRDETNVYQEPHVSGEIVINSDGTGFGTISMYNEPVADLYLTGRTAGFEGYFTLYRENHHTRHNF